MDLSYNPVLAIWLKKEAQRASVIAPMPSFSASPESTMPRVFITLRPYASSASVISGLSRLISLLAGAGSFSLIGGVLLGAIGAIAGSFLGYFARSRITGNFGLPDLPVALVEDVICIAGSFFVVSLFSGR